MKPKSVISALKMRGLYTFSNNQHLTEVIMLDDVTEIEGVHLRIA